jgi:hypothetical protein
VKFFSSTWPHILAKVKKNHRFGAQAFYMPRVLARLVLYIKKRLAPKSKKSKD